MNGWIRCKDNPIISPEKNSWDADAVYKPTVVFNKKEKQLLLWFNGRKKNSEKIGMASYMV